MFGGKKATPAIDVINTVLKSGSYSERRGAISLSQKDGRKTINTGILYVDDNEIYAAEIEHIPFNMGTRVFSTGELSRENFQETHRKFGGQLNHPGLLPYLLENQLITDSRAVRLSAEYFITMVEIMFGWENVSGEWKEGRTYEYSLIDTNLSLAKVNSFINKRKKIYRNFDKLTDPFFPASAFNELSFIVRNRMPNGVSHEMSLVYKLCQNGTRVNDVSQKTGLTPHSTFQILMGFWKSGVVDIAYGDQTTSYEKAISVRNAGIGQDYTQPEHFHADPFNAQDVSHDNLVVDDKPVGNTSTTQRVFTASAVIIDGDDGGTIIIDDNKNPPHVPPVEKTRVFEMGSSPQSAQYSAAESTNQSKIINSESSSSTIQPEIAQNDESQKLSDLHLKLESKEHILFQLQAESRERERRIGLMLEQLSDLESRIRTDRDELSDIESKVCREESVVNDLRNQIEAAMVSVRPSH